MQFTANRLLLLKAVKTALKVVRPNRDIPEIAGVLIEADASSGLLTVTGTDVRTHIQRRLRQEQVEELARILGGVEITDAVRLNADEMKDMAERTKKY